MKGTGWQVILFCVVVTLFLIVASCTTGPEAPRVGTPAFYWSAARTTYSVGDYTKVNDNLGEIIKSDNEYTARALPWRLVLLSGMAKGYMDLAENFEVGGRANRANPTPFRKQATLYRTQAGQLTLQFAETLQKFRSAGKAEKVTFAFSYPTGSAAEIPALKRVYNGILVPESEIVELGKRVLERSVLLATCRAAGAPDDTAKTQQIFKSDPVQVSWTSFTLALANSLYEQSQLFTRTRLDRPDRIQMFCNQALELLKDVPETKETKALGGKIKDALKKAKA